MSTFQQTIRGWAAHELVTAPRTRKVMGGAIFVLLTTVGAYVSVPLPPQISPVPLTLQPLFVILAGAVLGPRAGALAMASYVLLGAAGAPVFAMGRGGWIWLLHPSGGYLLSYPLAAFVVGLLAGKHAGKLRLFGALTVGMAVIYLGGASQLWLMTRPALGTLMMQSVLPFLPGDLFKIVVAWATVRSLRSTSFGRLP
jgi:biotin transport system substrate-specific component